MIGFTVVVLRSAAYFLPGIAHDVSAIRCLENRGRPVLLMGSNPVNLLELYLFGFFEFEYLIRTTTYFHSINISMLNGNACSLKNI